MSAPPTENSTFKLYYFNIQALAEPIRYIFAYGGQKYEDVRVTKEEWGKFKSSEYLSQLYLHVRANIVLMSYC